MMTIGKTTESSVLRSSAKRQAVAQKFSHRKQGLQHG